jgi:mono/diheme cytochrome c family protein
LKAERNRQFVGALRRSLLVLAPVLALLAVGCRQDMHDQAKYQPLEASDLFPDGMASRPVIANTVARGQLQEDVAFFTGKDEAGEFVATFPLAQLRQAVEEERWFVSLPGTDSGDSRAILRRGQQRYEMFCTHCHGRTGEGNGMIVQRGFKKPESYHSDRLRASAPGYFVNVMTEGFGQMSTYRHMVKVEDRWAIAAYIQALQLSQSARASDLSPEDLDALQGGGGEHDSGDHHGGDGHSGAK